ncbi:MAG: transcription antitermination factor NusB, partial [Clostridiales Family XIII bacterium]|nr:transcription antitermination factor NusB [Clostridiales Family XIII bacterium]
MRNNMKSPSTHRKKTRELLMRLLFQMAAIADWSDAARDAFLADETDWCGNPSADTPPGALFDTATDEAPDLPYFLFGLDCVRGHLAEIDGEIEAASDKWRVARMAGVDLAILRLALAEMRYMDGIDVRVSINEAVNLAKKYGSEKSPAFINGILGQAAQKGGS